MEQKKPRLRRATVQMEPASWFQPVSFRTSFPSRFHSRTSERKDRHLGGSYLPGVAEGRPASDCCGPERGSATPPRLQPRLAELLKLRRRLTSNRHVSLTLRNALLLIFELGHDSIKCLFNGANGSGAGEGDGHVRRPRHASHGAANRRALYGSVLFKPAARVRSKYKLSPPLRSCSSHTGSTQSPTCP